MISIRRRCVLVYSGFVTKVSSPVTTLTGGPMTNTKMNVIIHQKKKKKISFLNKTFSRDKIQISNSQKKKK